MDNTEERFLHYVCKNDSIRMILLRNRQKQPLFNNEIVYYAYLRFRNSSKSQIAG